MTNAESGIEAILAAGEGPHVEFKSSIPPPRVAARNIAALANSGGGKLLIGVGDDGQLTAGVDVHHAKASVRRALDLISPRPMTAEEIFNVGDGAVVVVSIDPSVTPTLSGGVVYTRRDGVTGPADAKTLVAAAGPADSLTKVIQTVERFADVIEKQSHLIDKLQNDNSWRYKLLWASIGAPHRCGSFDSDCPIPVTSSYAVKPKVVQFP